MTFIIDSINPREPGGEISLKAKKRWEILRRTDNYHRDWDAAFAKMVNMLKAFVILGHEDYGCEPDREKMEEASAELMKDPQAWKSFLEKRFQRDWPPAKLREEFLYSHYFTESRELADKYGLFIPYYYDDPIWDPFKDRMEDVFKDLLPVRIITQNPTLYEIGPDRKVIANHMPHLRDGRFLTIEVDLYEKLGTLKKLINSQLYFYQNLLKLHKAKKRGPALDFYLDTEKGKVSIYELWDMNKKEGKSAWRITQELYPSITNGKNYQPHNANYDKEARRIWWIIDQAIILADSEIKSFLDPVMGRPNTVGP